MKTLSFNALLQAPLRHAQLVNVRDPNDPSCVHEDIVAIHLDPLLYTQIVQQPPTVQYFSGRQRMDGGPYVGTLFIRINGYIAPVYLNPGDEAVVQFVHRVIAKGRLRLMFYNVFGAHVLLRSEGVPPQFMESLLEVHEVSKGVTDEAFEAAADIADFMFKHPDVFDNRDLIPWPYETGSAIYSARTPRPPALCVM